jgi:hypothetical protein
MFQNPRQLPITGGFGLFQRRVALDWISWNADDQPQEDRPVLTINICTDCTGAPLKVPEEPRTKALVS